MITAWYRVAVGSGFHGNLSPGRLLAVTRSCVPMNHGSSPPVINVSALTLHYRHLSNARIETLCPLSYKSPTARYLHSNRFNYYGNEFNWEEFDGG